MFREKEEASLLLHYLAGEDFLKKFLSTYWLLDRQEFPTVPGVLLLIMDTLKRHKISRTCLTHNPYLCFMTVMRTI